MRVCACICMCMCVCTDREYNEKNTFTCDRESIDELWKRRKSQT